MLEQFEKLGDIAAYLYTPVAMREAVVGLLSLLRNEGGSVGTSLAQTMQERRDQFHSLRLGELLDPFNATTLRRREGCADRNPSEVSTWPPFRLRPAPE